MCIQGIALWDLTSIQLHSRSCGSLAKVLYGPEIKSNIKAGSWCIKQIFWENRWLNRQKSASLCMFWPQFWTFPDKKTSHYLLTTWLCKRKIFNYHDYASNLTSFLAIWQCHQIYILVKKVKSTFYMHSDQMQPKMCFLNIFHLCFVHKTSF